MKIKVLSLVVIMAALLMLLSGCGEKEGGGGGGTGPETPTNVEVEGVSLNESSAELTEGETLQLSATISPSNATNKTLKWDSDTKEVATVDAKGLVTAVSVGSAKITVTTGNGKSASCSITVKKGTVAVTSITLDKKEVTLVEGEEIELVATVSPDDATDKTVTWESSEPEIASVEGGKVKALSPGVATISAKAGDKSATCVVTVEENTSSGNEDVGYYDWD